MSVGEVKGESFVKLLEVLAGSVLLYGAKMWGDRGLKEELRWKQA